MERTCKKCGETKPIEQFHKQSTIKGTYKWNCKKCVKAYNKEYFKAYYQIHSDRYKNNAKDYRENNKDKVANQKKIYRAENRNRIRELEKIWYKLNKDKVLVQAHEYYVANRNNSEFKDKRKKYRENNKDNLKLYRANYYINNMAELKKRNRKYYVENKDKVLDMCNKYKQEHIPQYKEWLERMKHDPHSISVKRRYRNNGTKELANWYVVLRLKKLTGVNTSVIKCNPKLMELYKVNLKLKRLIKNNENEKCNRLEKRPA